MNYIQGLAAFLPSTTFSNSFNLTGSTSNPFTSSIGTGSPTVFNNPEPDDSATYVVFL